MKHIAFALIILSSSFAFAGTPVVTATVDSDPFIGEEFCFDATLTNSNAGEVGYGPYLRVVLDQDFTLNSATFLGNALPATNEGTFGPPPSPGNELIDSVSGTTVTGNENEIMYTIRYPVGSVTSGSPDLEMNLCVMVDNAAVENVLQTSAATITPGFEFGNTATGVNGAQVGVDLNANITPRIVVYTVDDMTSEDERPPGPAWTWDVEACADIAGTRTVTPLDFATIEPITLPANVQFVGPITFTGGTGCASATTPADLTAAPGGDITLECASGTGITANDAEVCATFPVYITDTLDNTTCATEGALNEAKHVSIQKSNSGSNVPGGTRSYSFAIQVSEFVPGISRLEITDVLPDGLTFNDDATLVYEGGLPINLSGALRTISNNTPGTGQTTIELFVSDAVGADLAAASSATLTYTTGIDQTYASTGDPLLARDTLVNTLSGDYDVAGMGNASMCSEGSNSSFQIIDVDVSKTLISPVSGILETGDAVTFRLSMTIPSGDTDDVFFRDFFPLPVFDVTTISTNTSLGANPNIALGPGDTLGLIPDSISVNAADNSLVIEWPDVVTTSTQTLEIDVTLNVSVEPFADGLVLSNLFQAETDNSIIDNKTDLTLVPITVRAPDLSIVKSVVGSTSGYEPDDTVSYTIVVTNDSVDEAYDVIVSDTTPTGLTNCVLDSTANGSGGGADSPFDGDGFEFTSFDGPNTGALDGGASVTLNVSCDVDISVTPGQTISNEASVVWAANVGATSFPPMTSDPVDVTTANAVNPVKTLIDSSESATPQTPTPPELAIGEVARFRMYVEIPEGTQTGVSIIDRIPPGLQFVNDGTANMAFVSTSTGAISSTLFNQADCVAGTLEQTGALAGITPDCQLPAFAGPFASGDDVTLNLGTVVSDETDADAEYILLELNVIALDNQTNGQTRNNGFRLDSNEVTVTGNRQVEFVEPLLEVTKTPSPTTADAGDTITYTVRIEHDANSLADAFEIAFTDTLDGTQLDNFMFISGPVAPMGETCTAGSLVSNTADPFGAGLSITFASLPQGEVCEISYSARILGSVLPSATISNTAAVAYDSLEGTGDAGNTTGSTQGAQLTDSQNDMATVNVAATVKNKSIDSTSFTHTSDVELGVNIPTARPVSIGETVRYRLEVRLPEGNAPAFIITDSMPDGMQYVSGSARIALLAEGAGISPTPAIACLNAGTLNVVGNEADLAATEPDCEFAASGGPFVNSTNPVFDFGDLMNNDMDANEEYVIVEYDALVLNSLDGQEGNFAANLFNLSINGSGAGLSSPAVVRFVEPQLTCGLVFTPNPVNNLIDPTPSVSAAYTLTNNGSATAFQAGSASGANWIIDLPTGLENITGVAVNLTGNVYENNSTTPIVAGDFAVSGGDNNTLTIDSLMQLDPSASIEVSFDADLQDIVPGTSLSDTCVVAYRGQALGDQSTGVRDDSDLATGSGNQPINDTTDVNDYRDETTVALNTPAEDPEIGLAKRVSVAPASQGDGTYTMTYEILVENTGNVGLDTVAVVDALDTTFASATSYVINNVAVVSDSSSLVEDTNFDGSASNNNLLVPGSSSLPVGESGTITIELTVTPGATLGVYSNQASASAGSVRSTATVSDLSDDGALVDSGDGDPTNDSDPTTTTFVQNAEIGVAKQITAGPTNNMDGTYTLTYTFYVENTGDTLLNSVNVSDDLATVFTDATSFSLGTLASTDFTVNGSFTGGGANTNLLDGTDSLNAGESGTITLAVTVTPGGDLGPYDNTATATGTPPSGAAVTDVSDNAATVDADPNNDSDVTPVSFVEGPRIGVAKQITAGPANNMDGTYTLTYTFVIENAGDIVLNDLELIDELDTVFGAGNFVIDNLASADFTVNGSYDGLAASDANLLGASNSLMDGDTGSLTLEITVTPGAILGPYNNTATAEGTSPGLVMVTDVSDDGSDPDGDNDGNPNNDGDDTPVTFTEDPEIGIAKSISAGPTNNSDGTYTLTYLLILENTGDVVANGVQVADTLATTFASAASFVVDDVRSADFSLDGAYDGNANDDLLDGTDNLAASASGTIEIDVTITPGAFLGAYNNLATMTATSPAGTVLTDNSVDGTDPDFNGNGDPADDTSFTAVTFSEDPVIGVAKAIAGNYINNGDGSYELGYTFNLENFGDVDLTDVQVVEDLTATFSGAPVVVESIDSMDFTVNPGFDGVGNNNLLASGNILNVGQSGQLDIRVTVTPGANLGPHDNTVQASGTSPSGAVVNDDSVDGVNPDPDNDDDPSNNTSVTPVTFVEDFGLGVAKAVSNGVPNFDGTFNATVTLELENLGTIELRNMQLVEDLATNLAPATIVSVNNVMVSGGLSAANAGFDGDAQTNVLAGSQTLALGQTASVSFDMVFDAQCSAGPFSNSVTVSGVTPAGTAVNDDSQTGSNPDPDNDNDGTNNDEPTVVTVTVGDNGVVDAINDWLPTDDLVVTVTDSDQNKNSGAIETVSVTITNDTTGEVETLVLTETGAATGVFTANQPSERGAGPGADNNGTMTIAFDDAYTISYLDTLSATACVEPFTTTGRATGFGTLIGNAWLDANINDTFDGGEAPLDGWVVELKDDLGNVVTTVNVGADGTYTIPDIIPQGGYTITLLHPATGTVFGMIENITVPPDTIVIDQNLPIDPSGVFYDSVTRGPIEGVTATFVDGSGTPLPAACLLPSQQPQLTGPDGFYRFDVIADADPACASGSDFFIEFTVPAEYEQRMSTLIAPLDGPLDPTGQPNPLQVSPQSGAPLQGDSTDYYLGFNLAFGDPNVIFNHIPLDPVGVDVGSVRLTKNVDRRTTTVGSLVAYTITVENLSPVTLNNVDIRDSLPGGFSFVDGSARVNGLATGFNVTGPRPVMFTGLSIPSGETSTLRYLLRVGAGVTQGDYVNTAEPFLNGLSIGNSDTATIEITADPDFEQTTIIGKVWHDRDGDAWQDEADATGLIIRGGPFGEGQALADLPGRVSEHQDVNTNSIVLTVPYSDETLVLESKEGTTVELNANGGITQSVAGSVLRGLNGQDLILTRERIMTEASKPVTRTITTKQTVASDTKLDPIRFASGKAAIPDSYLDALRAELERLADKKNVRVEFVGHTDNERLSARTQKIYGDNQGLSDARAKMVADVVQAQLGLASDAITTSGYGDTQPLAGNDTPEGMALNRRVETIVTYDDVVTEQVQEQAMVDSTVDTGQMRITVVNRGIQEEGLAGIRLATTEGLVIETDRFGRYHIAGVDGGFMERGRNYIVKVDDATLPDGSEFTTENPRVKRITQGLMNQFDFGVKLPQYAQQAPSYTVELSAELFRAGGTTFKKRYAHMFDELVESLNAWQQGAIMIKASDASPSAMNVAMKRAKHLRERLQSKLKPEVFEQIDIQVVAAAAITSKSSAKPSIWQRGLGLLVALMAQPAMANDLCTLEHCMNDGAVVSHVTRRKHLETVHEAPVVRQHGRYRVPLPEGGVVWLNEDAADMTPRLAVAGPRAVALSETGRVMQNMAFVAYTNYGAFINDAKLNVYLENDIDRVQPLAVLEPIQMPGSFSGLFGFMWSPDVVINARNERLAYVLEVRDAEGRLDRTQAGFIDLMDEDDYATWEAELNEKRAEQDEKVSLPAEFFGENSNIDTARYDALTRVYGRSQLVKQNIVLNGSRVRLQGYDTGADYMLYVDDQWVPIDLEGKFAAEYLLPVGEYQTNIAIGHAEHGYWLRDIGVDVTGEHSFMVGLADLTLTEASLDGALEPLSGNERYNEDFLTEGRLAFYLKAKVKGKYLITSQLDSREEQLGDILGNIDETDTRSLFRRLDPDRYYPVYGDDSTTIADTNTLGRMYVRVDWNKSQAVWGNFQTNVNHNEFIQYRRSLYGAQLDWRSTHTTEFDDSRTELSVFGSEAQTALGHVEFLGTGGSLYYFRHLDIIPGSEQVRIEIRDTDTNRTIENIALTRGVDYEVDELQGRIILSRPLLQVAQQAQPSIIKEGPIDGDAVILIADYEYVPVDFDDNNVTSGVSAKHWLGDHVGVDVTYLNEGRGSEDYSLAGLGLTFKAGNGTYLKLESASSEATQTERLFSSNGGLSFSQLNPSNDTGRAGDAFGLESRINMQELGWTKREVTAAAWWRRTDDQFSVARRDDGVDVYETGVELATELSDVTNLSFRASEVEREATLTERDMAVQLAYATTEKSTVSTEVRQIEQSVVGGQDVDATLAAVQYAQQLGKRAEAYVSAQATLDNDDGNYDNNDLATVGVSYGLTDKTTLLAEGSTGHRGDGVTATLEHKLNADHTVYGTMSHSTDRTSGANGLPLDASSSGFNQDRLLPGNTLGLGHRSRISNQVKVFNETTFADASGAVNLGHVFGLDFGTESGFIMGLTLQRSDVAVDTDVLERNAVTLSGGYRSNGFNWTSRIEHRDDDAENSNDNDAIQWASINRMDFKLNRDYRFLGRFNFADTEASSSFNNDAKLIEGGLGLAYRPVNNNRLNWLAKYTYLYDLPSAGQVDNTTDQRSQVFSVEGIRRMNARWSFGAKLARRIGELRIDRSNGDWFESQVNFGALRARYHVVSNWDALAEYRVLDVKDADSKRAGWLVAAYRHIGEHAKVGLGYNFTDFSDDLTNLDYEYDGFFLNVVGKY